MIPERVIIRNFLTYGEDPSGGPIVFDFSGARLWSIGGDNGAGKSTVFDAIRYCLFGEHRGGSQNDNRLVRKGTDGAAVEFDFRYGGELYRVRRTVTPTTTRKGELKETKAVGASSFDDTVDDWVPIAGTDGITGLERWVKDLGLRPDVFNATVLLQQGGADKILTEPPKKRFEIFSTIVDLAPYERLSAAAGGRRKDAATEARTLNDRLARIQAVSDEDLAVATTSFEAKTQALQDALDDDKTAAAVLDDARRAAGHVEQLAKLAAREAEIDSVLADADRVTERFDRHNLLLDARVPVAAAERALTAAENADREGNDAREKLGAVDKTALETERVTAAAAVVEKQGARDNLLRDADAIARALPDARAVIAAQDEVARRAAAATEAGDPVEWESELNLSKSTLQELEEELATVAESQTQLQEIRAQAEAQVTTLTNAILARRNAAEEGTCSRCGQSVGADHLARELADLETVKTSAAKVADDAEQNARQISATAKSLSGELKALSANINEANTSLKLAANAAAELARVVDLLDIATTKATGLPKPWREILAAGAEAVEEEARSEQKLRLGADAAGHELDLLREKWQTAIDAVDGAAKQVEALDRAILVAAERAEGFRREAEAHLVGADPAVAADFRIRREAALVDLDDELAALVDAPAALAKLTNAREDRTKVLAETRAATEALDAILIAHRVPVEEAEEKAEAAGKIKAEAQTLRDDAYATLRDLTTARQERLNLGEEIAKAEKTGRVAGRLAELVGRGGLQAQLLRQAVQGVEMLANDTLSRLSGGGLTVELRCGEDKDGSKLEVWVGDAASADEPLEANFISGSQKFRVAVAIAAGLGQYLAGPEAVRSLIIDEGFGSLDEAGREVMIAELRGLAEHLERVIVVSHHADFSDPARFPNSFTLRKIGRHTEVTRRV